MQKPDEVRVRRRKRGLGRGRANLIRLGLRSPRKITSTTFYWSKQLESQPRFKGSYKSSNLPLYPLLVRFDKKC